MTQLISDITYIVTIAVAFLWINYQIGKKIYYLGFRDGYDQRQKHRNEWDK